MRPVPPPGVHVLRSEALEAWVLPFGARLVQLWWLQAPGGPRPLSLGFADPADYRQDTRSIGAVCGRYANRLADARLQRDGQHWALDANHPMGHCIHGGREGFGQCDWTVRARAAARGGLHDAAQDSPQDSPQDGLPDSSRVQLLLHSPDGHMGFPGDCQAEVIYRLEGAVLHWEARAVLGAACPVNLVQHSYWNLDGQPDLSGHWLQVPAHRYHPTDARELPLPAVPVTGTALDFERATRVPMAALDDIDAALNLDSPLASDGLRLAATLGVADLRMTLRTDRPLVHVYAGCYLRPGAAPLGVPHQRGAGLCLETEDMPNGPALGADVWYGPNRPYRHRMSWSFEAQSA